MATKIICDGCGEEIKAWKSGDPTSGDGLTRRIVIHTSHIHQQWDLCDPCQGKIAEALVAILPHTPREEWFAAIRPIMPKMIGGGTAAV